MSLSFEVVVDDVAALHKTYFQSVTMKQMRPLLWWSIAFNFLISAAPRLSHGLGNALVNGLAGAVIACLIMFLVLKLTPLLLVPLMRKQMREATGAMTLDLTPVGLREVGPNDETIFYWHSIGNIVTTPSHTFIYRGTSKAIIIPHSRIMSGNYQAFMQAFADVYADRRDQALQAV